MGTSKLNIFNAALLSVGGGQGEVKILKSDTDTGTAGDLCRACYDVARRQALARIRPREATAYAQPGGALTSEPVAPDWDYFYKYPDCVIFLGVIKRDLTDEDEEDPCKYGIGGNDTLAWIGTDEENDDIYFKYVCDLKDPGKFSPSLEQAIALEMAQMMTVALTNKDGLKAMLEQLQTRAEAIARDDSEIERYDKHNAELDTPMAEIT